MTDERMELLAPAGDMDALRAAVQNGADAVYLGAGQFNARRRAGNFDGDGLRAAVDYCHARNVSVHVTLNTLVRQDELEQLYDTVDLIYKSGADAVIVQDLGVARAVRRMAPEMELHASTQMAAHNVQAAQFLKAQGFDRVVLAREATFEDMADCAMTGIDVEVFVHGALCVACSGQCLMSSLVGGRSGNRGMCAQPCRLPWRLDGCEGYLLSTRDLCGIDDLARLRTLGVRSLKIEGRLKRAEYVAVTVAAYRRALDRLYEGMPADNVEARARLGQMFNRGGFTRGYGPGMAEDALMFPDRPNHIGVRVGACEKTGRVLLDKDVEAADALVLQRGDKDIPVKLFGEAGQNVPCAQAVRGDQLMRLACDADMRAARQSIEGEHRLIPLTATLHLRVGQPGRLTVSDGRNTECIEGEIVQAATGRPFDPERAAQQLGKTGGTPYTFAKIDFDADDNAFAPASMLNALRRSALDRLTQARTAVDRTTLAPEQCDVPSEVAKKPLLYAQSGNPEILRRAIDWGADIAVYCPEDIRNLDVSKLPGQFALALPAVLTAEALDRLNAWANEHGDRITETFVSNIGQFGMKWPGRLTGDFLLNIANDLTVAQFHDWGMDTVTPSVELTARQIDGMGGRKRLIVWGRLPLMHLRHCPLRAVTGAKGLHRDCRHCDACAPGDRLNAERLIDRMNAEFPLRRVAMPGGCVVQVLNSAALMPLRHLDRLPRASGWRLLLDEDDPVEAVTRVYRAALDGQDFKSLPEWRTLDAMKTTTGHYFRGVE